VGVFSISVVDLLADLLGKSELNILAGRGSKLSDALLKGLGDLLDLRDGDALLLREVLTADSGEGDGLVDTGLDGFGVDNLHSRLHNSEDRDIVASLLGNLLAVVVAIAVVAVARGGLADSHHLGVTFLLERNLNSLGSSGLSLRLVRVGANFIVNFFDALRAHSPCDYVALLSVNNVEAGELHRVADSLEGRGAHLSGLNNILNTAVVLGLLVGMISRGSMVNRGMVHYRGSMVYNRGSMVHNRGSMMYNRGSMVGNSMVGNSVVSYNWGSMHSMSNRSSMGYSVTNMGESGERNCSFSIDQRNESNQSKDFHDAACMSDLDGMI